MLNSIRVRLTLWYVIIFGSLLVSFSIFFYLTLSKNLRDRLDHTLENAASSFSSSFQREMKENADDSKVAASETLRETILPEVYAAIFENDQLLSSTYPAGQKVVIPTGIVSSEG